MQEVRRLRKARGWNQTELAFYAGLAPSVISQIENGKRSPNASTLEKLAKALGVNVGDLFPKTQAPLPFDEQEEQRRSLYLAAWVRYMHRRARYWEQVLVEEGEGLFVRERFPDATLRYEAMQDEAFAIFETVFGVYQDLKVTSPSTKIGQDEREELILAVVDLHGVTQKWNEKVDRAWITITAEIRAQIKAPQLVQARERVERAIKGRENMEVLFSERLVA
jgi:transcriptional regulator with XRE-family HTH domain